MAFSTEFIMGAGGGSGIDLDTHEQAHSPTITATTVGEPHVVDKAGVHSVVVFGNLTNAPPSGNMRLELLVNGAVIEASASLVNAASISCFQVIYLAAGDAITMRVSASGSGISSTVFYEPTIAVAPIDTVGDGTAHAGGPIELTRDQWRTLESHTVARSGVILVDCSAVFATAASAQFRITVNGQERIGNPVRTANERWYRALTVDAGDVVAAQAYNSSFSSSGRIVNNWTIAFH